MKSNRKQLIGKVVSNKMEKTIVVEIENLVMHTLYKKSVKRTKKVNYSNSQAVTILHIVCVSIQRRVRSKNIIRPYSKSYRPVQAVICTIGKGHLQVDDLLKDRQITHKNCVKKQLWQNPSIQFCV